jgi:hypothetical protein
MSYRNPTYYGIVEDVGAFDKAFQTAFSNVKSQIDADKAEKEKREKLIEEMKASDITSITNIAKNLPIELQQTAINYYSGIIDEGINYEDMDAVQRAKIDQTIQLHASALGNMNEIIQNYEDYENVPEEMKTAMAMLASGKIKPTFDSNDIKIGNYGLSEIAVAFNNANKISGTSDYSAGLVNNIAKSLIPRLKIKQQIDKQNLSDSDIKSIVEQYIENNSSILNNEQNDYIWKNLISDEIKEQDGMSTFGYDLNKVAKKDRKIFENKRNIAIGDYLTEQAIKTLKNTIPPYIAPTISKPRTSATAEKEAIKTKDIQSARSAMEKIPLTQERTFPTFDGPKTKKTKRNTDKIIRDFNDEILAKNYEIIDGGNGTYVLEYKKATSAQIKDGTNRTDITNLVKELKNDNPQELIDRLMSLVYEETAMYRGININ